MIVRRYFERVVSCEEFVRRIARYSIELGVVRDVRRNVRYLFKEMLGKCKEFV